MTINEIEVRNALAHLLEREGVPCPEDAYAAKVRTRGAEAAPPDQDWLNVERLADVEVTSEDAGYPIEAALLQGRGSGWRAAQPGRQTIRLLFTSPQRLRRIWLVFAESTSERTQEYVLRWSSGGGQSFREIVRQQWNFSPQGATCETEDHRVELSEVAVLELSITPDTSGKIAFASLAQLRIA